MAAILTVILGPETGLTVPILGDELVIGRGGDSELRLSSPHKRLSRKHVRLSRRSNDWVAEDLQSQNGSWIDGRQATAPMPLRNGSAIRAGEYVLLFQVKPEVPTLRIGNESDDASGKLRTRPAHDNDATISVMSRGARGLIADGRLAVLRKVIHRAARGGDEDVAVREILAAVLPEFGSDRGGVALVDDNGRLVGGPAVRLLPNSPEVELRAGAGLRCVREDIVLLFEPAPAIAPGGAPAPVPVRHLIAPLNAGGRVLGVLQIDCAGGLVVPTPPGPMSPTSEAALPPSDGMSGDDFDFASAVADVLAAVIDSARSRNKAADELKELRFRHFADQPIVGKSSAMQQVLSAVARLCEVDTDVLLIGEPGVGKELFAGRIHFAGSRSGGPFLFCDCAGKTPELLHAELFGSENGEVKGKFALAHNGTLYLDNVQQLPAQTQTMLHQVLETRGYTPRPGGPAVRVNIRVVCATSADLEEFVDTGRFQLGLYERVSRLPLRIPPLRERPEDILELADFFLERFSRGLGRKRQRLAADLRRRLAIHSFPGNVRRLRHAIERLVVLCPNEEISTQDWGNYLPPGYELEPETATDSDGLRAPTDGRPPQPHPAFDLEEAEKRQILRALEHTRSSPSEAARLLGIARGTLYRKMERYGIKPAKEG
jgi:Nif-specific regulatory protein